VRLQEIAHQNTWHTRVAHAFAALERRKRAASRTRDPRLAVFAGQRFIEGTCNVCGRATRYFYSDRALYRESLVCEH
jgi:hypothetical protein